ncbi:MAG TPA: FUSC family protein [Gammaproteobacteria bacterium]|nr:FUSC family protein [Gammaproteobacteria bacterium]
MQLAALRGRLIPSGSTRILISQALRATFAAAVPFVALRLTGHPAGALFTTIAALFLSIADGGGGPYRQRLTVMLLVTGIVPIMLFAGMHTRETWYAATVVMFFVATAAGMTRLLGTAGIPIGLQSGLGFVVGLYVPGGLEASLHYMGYYVAGALWTILLALLVWRVRPYRRIRYQAGDCFQRLGDTFALLRAGLASASAHSEDRLLAQERGNRQALDELRATMGAALGEGQLPPPFLADLIVLLHAAAHVDATAVGLSSALTPATLRALPEKARDDTLATIAALEQAASAIAAGLLSGRRLEPVELAVSRLGDLEQEMSKHPDSASLSESFALLEACARQLRIAERAAARLAGGARRQLAALPPLHGPVFPNFSLHQLRANLTPRSLIFRHGVRLGIAAALATALYLVLHIPHGIWLPLTVLLIMQPHFGATLPRALHRVAGTLVGSVIAGLCILALGGTPGIDVAILVCVFFTIVYVRRRYWVAVAFITPLIILLLDLLTHHPWVEIVERIGDTLAGAVIAVVAGYLLWPSPERRRLPELLLDAVEAVRTYLDAAFAPLAGTQALDIDTETARGAAELAIANADAALGRMLAEPRHMRSHADETLTVLAYLQRVSRHLTRLSVYVSRRPWELRSADPLRQCLDATLRAIVVIVGNQGAAAEVADSEPACLSLEAECRQEAEQSGADAAAIAFQIGEIVDDVNNLAEACARYRGAQRTF